MAAADGKKAGWEFVFFCLFLMNSGTLAEGSDKWFSLG